jgi:hypothetical protein
MFANKKKQKTKWNKKIGGWGAIDRGAIVLGGYCPGAIVIDPLFILFVHSGVQHVLTV